MDPLRRNLLAASAAVLLCGGTGRLCPAQAAPASQDKVFLAKKQEILLLAMERTRAAHHDYQRTLKTGENRIRDLHENYKLAGSTPPTALDGDVQELSMATQKVRLRRSRGRDVPPDPAAQRLIELYWEEYKREYEALAREVPLQREAGVSDGQLYWTVMKKFADLRARTQQKLVHNAPPGQFSLDEALLKNEWGLLKSLERLPVRTRGRVACVVAPGEHAREVNVDIAPFYHSQGLLPTQSPQAVGAFTVPAGCRTVTQRESGRKVIFRVSRGKGVAYIGSADKEISYGYLLVPPDVPYYIENVTESPLDLEFVALPG